MRPPLIAGENNHERNTPHHRKRSFNEAPAYRGGKPGGRLEEVGEFRRFNEAPAYRGGKQPFRLTLQQRDWKQNLRAVRISHRSRLCIRSFTRRSSAQQADY